MLIQKDENFQLQKLRKKLKKAVTKLEKTRLKRKIAQLERITSLKNSD